MERLRPLKVDGPQTWATSFPHKVARCPWGPRTFLAFAIKTGSVLDSWKTFCCSWVFSRVLESSWRVVKLFIIELLISLHWTFKNLDLNTITEQNNLNFRFSVVMSVRCAVVISTNMPRRTTTFQQSAKLWEEGLLRSPVTTGGFGGLGCPKQISKPPQIEIWNTISK